MFWPPPDVASWNRLAGSSAYWFVAMKTAGSSTRSLLEASTFDDVYRAQYSRMVVLARLLVESLGPAEEIVQDAFVDLYRRWSSVEFPVAYVRSAVVDGCRSFGRRQALSRRHGTVVDEELAWDPTAIELRDALRVLTPRQRAAIVLRYYEDLPEQQIAEVLDCRPGTVKSLLSRALARLKGEFDE